MGILTPGEQGNMEYLKLKYSPSTPDHGGCGKGTFLNLEYMYLHLF